MYNFIYKDKWFSTLSSLGFPFFFEINKFKKKVMEIPCVAQVLDVEFIFMKEEIVPVMYLWEDTYGLLYPFLIRGMSPKPSII